MEETILLRPHHGMCLAFYRGRGYSPDFTRNMDRLQNILEKQNPLVRLAEGGDLICRACPHLRQGVCTDQAKCGAYDRAVLERCGLRAGALLPYRDFAAQVRQTILLAGHREEICGDCQWTDLCRFEPGEVQP